MKLIVRTPATTANLGSGFDTLGMALNIWNVYQVERSSHDEFIARGKYGDSLKKEKADEFFFERLRYLSKLLKVDSPKVRVIVDCEIPPSRGLGSSATVALAVLEIMDRLKNLNLKLEKKLKLLVDLEGHPDNVIPAFLGGLMAVSEEDGRIIYSKIPFPNMWKLVLFIPEFSVSTDMARKVLPNSYPRDIVVSQIRRMAFLMAGFYEENEDLIRYGMKDLIHQRYRFDMEKRMLELFEKVGSFDPISVFISGSGSTIGAIFRKEVNVPEIPNVEKVETSVSDGMKVEVIQDR